MWPIDEATEDIISGGIDFFDDIDRIGEIIDTTGVRLDGGAGV